MEDNDKKPVWRIGRMDMQSYTGDGEPVHFLYPPGDGDRIPFYGHGCVERAQQLCNLLNEREDLLRLVESCDQTEVGSADYGPGNRNFIGISPGDQIRLLPEIRRMLGISEEGQDDGA